MWSKLNYEAWLLLLFCVAPSVGYTQRCAPPSETLRMATTADDLLRSYVARIASLPDGCFNKPRVRGQVHLSNKHGGPNIHSAEAANKFAYTASLADFGAECCLRWPHTMPAFEEASRSTAPPPDTNPEAIDIELDDRAAWLKDLASQRAHIHANYPIGTQGTCHRLHLRHRAPGRQAPESVLHS
jgi:hypothetical protein